MSFEKREKDIENRESGLNSCGNAIKKMGAFFIQKARWVSSMLTWPSKLHLGYTELEELSKNLIPNPNTPYDVLEREIIAIENSKEWTETVTEIVTMTVTETVEPDTEDINLEDPEFPFKEN